MLNFLYNNFFGRILLKIIYRPAISRICGKIMDSRLSLALIPAFIKKHHIDLSEYITTDYKNFNDFFTRKVKPELRKYDEDENNFCAPCDGMLSIYSVHDDLVLPVKQSHYSVSDLLLNDTLASDFSNGLCLTFRLGVNNYHRYSYFDSGKKGENIFIPGVLHTVRPVALNKFPVFVRNSREYTVMDTVHFGKCVQIEVGALMVGKIVNEHGCGDFTRGAEKGHFEYGGSTIIVLLKNNCIDLKDKFKEIIDSCEEIPIRMGDVIGKNVT